MKERCFMNVSILIICYLSLMMILLLFLLKKQERLLKDVHQLKDILADLTQHSKTTQHHLQKELLLEKKAHVLLLAYQLRETVSKQEHAIHAKAIEDTPVTHGLTVEELARIFSPEQALLIQQYWSSYRSYVHKHWTNGEGSIKTVFRGNPNHLESELGQLHYASSTLVKQLDKWLIQLQ